MAHGARVPGVRSAATGSTSSPIRPRSAASNAVRCSRCPPRSARPTRAAAATRRAQRGSAAASPAATAPRAAHRARRDDPPPPRRRRARAGTHRGRGVGHRALDRRRPRKTAARPAPRAKPPAAHQQRAAPPREGRTGTGGCVAWFVAVPLGFVITAWPAYEFGLIEKDDVLDVFVGIGTGRYARLGDRHARLGPRDRAAGAAVHRGRAAVGRPPPA